MAVEVISSVLVAASAESPAGPYDLTDLETVHDELSIPTTDTSKDAFLSRAITQVSAVISTYCKRVFAIETVQDQLYIQQDPYPWQNPGLIYPLQLSRWPLVQTDVVAFTGNTHGSTTVDGLSSVEGLEAGMLVFASDGSLPGGTQIESVGAGQITLTEAATSSETDLSFTTGIQVVQTLSAGVTQTLTYGEDFTIDAAKGWLIRLNAWTGVSEGWEAIPTTVQYQAGYASSPDTMPADLQDACLRLVTARFTARGRDPMLTEQTQPQTLGTRRYWVGSSPGQTGALPPEIESLVEQYRVPTAG